MTISQLLKQAGENDLAEFMQDVIGKEITVNINAISPDAKSYVTLSKWLEESHKNLTPYKKEEFIWKTKDGRKLRPCDMDTGHIAKAISYLYNRLVLPVYQTCQGEYPKFGYSQIREAKGIIKILLEEWGKREDISVEQWQEIQLILGEVKTWN